MAKIKPTKQEMGLGAFITNFDGADSNLTVRLLEKFGLTKEQSSHLVQMNDGLEADFFSNEEPIKPKSFKQIANWIEKHIGVKQ